MHVCFGLSFVAFSSLQSCRRFDRHFEVAIEDTINLNCLVPLCNICNLCLKLLVAYWPNVIDTEGRVAWATEAPSTMTQDDGGDDVTFFSVESISSTKQPTKSDFAEGILIWPSLDILGRYDWFRV